MHPGTCHLEKSSLNRFPCDMASNATSHWAGAEWQKSIFDWIGCDIASSVAGKSVKETFSPVTMLATWCDTANSVTLIPMLSILWHTLLAVSQGNLPRKFFPLETVLAGQMVLPVSFLVPGIRVDSPTWVSRLKLDRLTQFTIESSDLSRLTL